MHGSTHLGCEAVSVHQYCVEETSLRIVSHHTSIDFSLRASAITTNSTATTAATTALDMHYTAYLFLATIHANYKLSIPGNPLSAV